MTCCRRTLNKIDGIDSLTVDLFNRLTRTIQSQSIFFIDRSIDCDRIALVDLLNRSTVIELFLSIFLKIENIERSKIERSKYQIPNPESSYVQREIIILICIKNLFWLGHRRVFLCSFTIHLIVKKIKLLQSIYSYDMYSFFSIFFKD